MNEYLQLVEKNFDKLKDTIIKNYDEQHWNNIIIDFQTILPDSSLLSRKDYLMILGSFIGGISAGLNPNSNINKSKESVKE